MVYSYLIIWTSLLALFLTCKPVYNVLFHPLRHFPGPTYCGASRLWYIMKIFQGTLNSEVKLLHDKYGPVVRIAPNELSYNTSTAWQPIYGRNKLADSPHLSPEIFKKDPIFYGGAFAEADLLVDADGEQYREQKQPLLNALSNQALVGRSGVLSHHVDFATARIREHCLEKEAEAIDLNAWTANLIFDTIATMVVSQNLGALETWKIMHPTIVAHCHAVSFTELYVQLRRLPRLFTYALELLPGFVSYDMLGKTIPTLRELVTGRLGTEPREFDFVSHMLQGQSLNAENYNKTLKNAVLLIDAGSETTTTWLTGTLFYLLTNPGTLALASKEIRSAFQKESDITMLSVQSLSYTKACLKEGSRIYPPVPFAAPRLVPCGGAHICGQYVPANTTVGVNQWATYRSARNFREADEFRPQRWLNDHTFKDDDFDALKPWGHGPRTCLAKNMAELSATFILARILWEFEMEIDPQSTNWNKGQGHIFPRRESLYVKMRSQYQKVVA